MVYRLKMNTSGLTLAEVLITLAVLAVIATFVVPKILSASSESENNHRTRQAVMELNTAFIQYQLDENITATTSVGDFTSYMNYTSAPSSGTIDDNYGSPPCVVNACVKLSNGAILMYDSTADFDDINTTNSLFFVVDPDGTANGSGAVNFVLYYDGVVRDYSDLKPNTYIGAAGPISSDSNGVASWFSWD